MIVMILTVLAATVVLMRVICLAARLDRETWTGPAHRFYGLAGGHALLAGGAVSALILPAWSPCLLLVGAALAIVSDRRRSI